jgi:hypothetical protein
MIPAAPRRPGRAVAIAPESEALLALAATELAELEAELATELTLLETLAAEEADDEAEEEAEDSELAEPVMLLRTEPVQLLVWERAERRFNGMSDLGRL